MALALFDPVIWVLSLGLTFPGLLFYGKRDPELKTLPVAQFWGGLIGLNVMIGFVWVALASLVQVVLWNVGVH